MHDRRDIRSRSAQEGATIRGVAREVGASRNAVRRALAADARLEYSRPSMAEEFEPAVREVLYDYPRISVAQVGEIVEWPGSRRALSSLVAKLRPEALRRHVDELNRPALGRLAVTSITPARIRVGVLTVGRIHVGPRSSSDPEGTT